MKAHTVQEAILRTIAEDGHVLGFSTDLGAIVSSKGQIIPRPIGVGEASTFTGFCEMHDSELFAEIEKQPVIANSKHAALLAYRAICRELYAKEGGLQYLPNCDQLDRGLPLSGQLALQTTLQSILMGFSTAANEIRVRKVAYDRIIKNSDYQQVRFCVIWLQETPDLMCCSGKNPTVDFAGRKLQDLSDLSTPAQGITVSIIASGNRGCAFFSWLKPEEQSCIALLDSLLRLKSNRIPDAIVRLAFGFENIYLRKSWWNSLSNPMREILIQRLKIAANVMVPDPDDVLVDDGNCFVDWCVKEVETNVEGLADTIRRIGLD